MKESISLALKRINNMFDKRANQLLLEQGLTSTQFKFLKFLYWTWPKTVIQQDLEKQFDLSNPTVTRVVQKLEQKDLIIREPHPKDARSKQLVLTEKAWQKQADLEELGRVLERELTQQLSRDEAQTLFQLLQKMVGGLDVNG